jgi:tripartite-type tricarboxylate transporter receptor subunit TctC
MRGFGRVTLARRCLLASALSFAAWLLVNATAAAQPFNGNTITFYVGFTAGGSYDFYARIVARYLATYIPGHPSIVVKTMAGAGSLTAANFLYWNAPKDGTAIGTVTQTLAIEQALHSPGVRYESAKFNWIGRMTTTLQVGVSRKESGINSIDDAKRAIVPMAGTGAGSPSEGYPKLLNELAGTKFKIISGFASSPQGLLAMERGEVDAVQTSWNTLKRSKQDWLRNHDIRLLYQCALARQPDLPDIPTTVELGATEEARQLLSFYTSSAEVGLSILAPPGVPNDRLATLRSAYESLLKDQGFLAEMEQTQVEFQPATGAAVARMIELTSNTPSAIIEQVERILR